MSTVYTLTVFIESAGTPTESTNFLGGNKSIAGQNRGTDHGLPSMARQRGNRGLSLMALS